MSEICGRFSIQEGDGKSWPGDSALLDELLGSEEHETVAGTGYLVAGKKGRAFLYSDEKSGISAVIGGDPQWTTRELTEMAGDVGHALALCSAYQKYDNDLFERLRGPFAVAIFDRHASRVLLAVDRMGIRPLCFGIDTDGSVVFGSRADTVLGLSSISDDVSAQSVYDFFAFHVVPTPKTIYKNVDRIEPGHVVEFSAKSASTSAYWMPHFAAAGSKDLSHELVGALRAAVARDLDGPDTGGFLSGGLDSSTICGTANDLTETDLKAYSIGFDEEGYDESHFAEVAAAKFELDWHLYNVTPADVRDAIDLIASFDQPFGNSSAVPTYFCAKYAAANGSRRLLAGDGGDELFGGNERYAKQLTFELYSRIPGFFRKQVLEKLLPNLRSREGSLGHKAKRYVEQARVPLPDRLFTYHFAFIRDPETIFTSDFLRNVNTDHPLHAAKAWYDHGNADDTIDKMLLFDWKLTLADNDLVKVNSACELAGIDVAYPLLDNDVVDVSLRVPVNQKLTRSDLRIFFKRTFSKFLPDETLKKSKHGFGLPFGEWLRSDPELQSIADLNLTRLAEREIFRREFLQEMQTRHREEHAAFYGNIIWVLMILNAWLDKHDVDRMS